MEILGWGEGGTLRGLERVKVWREGERKRCARAISFSSSFFLLCNFVFLLLVLLLFFHI